MQSSENKKTIEKYMDGFRTSDHEMILSCLTDDVRWFIPGAFDISGKEAFDKEIENENFVGKPLIQIFNIIEENDIVVAEGAVQSHFKNGEMLDMLFCDVFLMEDAKIKHLTSYLMKK